MMMMTVMMRIVIVIVVWHIWNGVVICINRRSVIISDGIVVGIICIGGGFIPVVVIVVRSLWLERSVHATAHD